MTELDIEIGPLALELINEFGKLIQYNKASVTSYNPATATVAGFRDPLEIRGIVEEYKGQAFLSGLIEGGDKKVTVAANAFTEAPTTQDGITIDDVEYRVVSVKISYSGDLAAIYELQCRG